MIMMTLTNVIITLLFLFNSPLILAQPPQTIFILAGQSNMAGRGGVKNGKWDGFIPPECNPNPNILRFTAQNSWVLAHEPLHVDIDVGKTCGVGPGMGFAHGLLMLGGSEIGSIGLVPCAVGGTKISEWGRGTVLYNQLVRRAKAAGGKIGGVLWYQGESDTVNVEDAQGYKGRMEKFIGDLRSDLALPSLLIIQVALASGEGKYIEKVREAQLGIKLANVKCVDAKGLGVGYDHLHLTTMSQVHLGLMLARSYLNIHKHHDSLSTTSSNSSLV